MRKRFGSWIVAVIISSSFLWAQDPSASLNKALPEYLKLTNQYNKALKDQESLTIGPNQRLRVLYLEELRTLQERAQNSGDLKKAVAAEEAAVEPTKGSIDKNFDEIASLQKIFLKEQKKILDKKIAAQKSITSKYINLLKKLEIKLTKAGNLKEALQINKKIEPLINYPNNEAKPNLRPNLKTGEAKPNLRPNLKTGFAKTNWLLRGKLNPSLKSDTPAYEGQIKVRKISISPKKISVGEPLYIQALIKSYGPPTRVVADHKYPPRFGPSTSEGTKVENFTVENVAPFMYLVRFTQTLGRYPITDKNEIYWLSAHVGRHNTVGYTRDGELHKGGTFFFEITPN